MIIGVPKEIKNHEYRVGLTPASVKELSQHQHTVLIETGAGSGSGFSDEDYLSAGAQIVTSATDVFQNAELIVKVKEPQHEERLALRPEQTLFTFLHLAPDIPQTQELLKSGATCIAYETVTDAQSRLPLLAPMSEVAGRMSVQAGAHCLEKSHGGRGVLLGGVPGVEPATVVVLGGGVVGSNAVHIAVGMGANVIVLDRSIEALRRLDAQYGNQIKTIYSTQHALEEWVFRADLVIGAVLIPGAAAPKLITRSMLQKMKPGAVIVDVAIDQGGCFETSKPTTHQAPTFIVDDVVHYCVANMPGALSRTSTQALNNATLPFVLELANQGVANAMTNNTHLLNGLNITKGKLTCPHVGEAQNLEAISPIEGLALLR